MSCANVPFGSRPGGTEIAIVPIALFPPLFLNMALTMKLFP